MTAPAFVISHGELVRELEPAAQPASLTLLYARALKLGMDAEILESSGWVLFVTVRNGAKRQVGSLIARPDDGEMRWALDAGCNAMEGLPMQADVLVANAAAVAAAFKALVGEAS